MDEKTMTIREVRDSLGRRVDAAHYASEVTVVTKNGEPRAVLVPHEAYLQYLEHCVTDPATGQ